MVNGTSSWSSQISQKGDAEKNQNVYVSHCALGWNVSGNEKEVWDNKANAVHVGYEFECILLPSCAK